MVEVQHRKNICNKIYRYATDQLFPEEQLLFKAHLEGGCLRCREILKAIAKLESIPKDDPMFQIVKEVKEPRRRK